MALAADRVSMGCDGCLGLGVASISIVKCSGLHVWQSLSAACILVEETAALLEWSYISLLVICLCWRIGWQYHKHTDPLGLQRYRSSLTLSSR